MSITIVAGSQRCGTSMMMRCLIAGGLEADYDPSRDQMNARWGDAHYQPNAGGFYELRGEQYRAPDFPRAHEGRLIKVLNEGVLRIAPRQAEDPYWIVFMRRDPEEMRQSWQAFFGPRAVHPLWRHGPDGAATFLDTIEGILRMRRDCRVLRVEYRDAVDRPHVVFARLRDAGLPIDPARAAAEVDPALCHMRREELEVGA